MWWLAWSNLHSTVCGRNLFWCNDFLSTEAGCTLTGCDLRYDFRSFCKVFTLLLLFCWKTFTEEMVGIKPGYIMFFFIAGIFNNLINHQMVFHRLGAVISCFTHVLLFNIDQLKRDINFSRRFFLLSWVFWNQKEATQIFLKLMNTNWIHFSGSFWGQIESSLLRKFYQ